MAFPPFVDDDILYADELNTLKGRIPFINVADYGAVGDNSTDNAAAFQAAIAAANPGGPGNAVLNYGNTIYIPPGVYRLNSVVTVQSNIVLRGAGNGASIIRNVGNHFAFQGADANGTQRVVFVDLAMDATAAQSSGGGVDLKTFLCKIYFDRVLFGDNLFCFVDSQKSGAMSDLFFRDISANSITTGGLIGVSGCTYGFILGGGNTQHNQIYMDRISCTAKNQAGAMGTWMVCKRTDTLHMNNALFQWGDNGIGMMSSSSGQPNTTHKFNQVVLDGQRNTGWTLESSTGFEWTNCNVQGLDGLVPAVWFKNTDPQNYGWTWRGGVIWNNAYAAVRYQGNATDGPHFDGVQFLFNNESLTSGLPTCVVDANASHFSFTNNKFRLHNGTAASISVATGSSDHYVITGNRRGSGNAAALVFDGGTGTNKYVAGNVN
jgi:hypothetical protein